MSQGLERIGGEKIDLSAPINQIQILILPFSCIFIMFLSRWLQHWGRWLHFSLIVVNLHIYSHRILNVVCLDSRFCQTAGGLSPAVHLSLFHISTWGIRRGFIIVRRRISGLLKIPGHLGIPGHLLIMEEGQNLLMVIKQMVILLAIITVSNEILCQFLLLLLLFVYLFFKHVSCHLAQYIVVWFVSIFNPLLQSSWISVEVSGNLSLSYKCLFCVAT